MRTKKRAKKRAQTNLLLTLATVVLLLGLAGSAAARCVTRFHQGIPRGGAPEGIVVARDGTVWFTLFGDAPSNGSASRTHPGIGRLDRGGHVTIFTRGMTDRAGPANIVQGADGAMWFTEFNGDRIGRVDSNGRITEYTKGFTGSEPFGLALAPDGAVWFTEGSGKIGRITTAGQITEFSAGIGVNSLPKGMALGPDGAMWFAELNGGRIGRITMKGRVHVFQWLGADSGPYGITRGSDGAMWFTESGNKFVGDGIGRITVNGRVREFSEPSPADGYPLGIVTGADRHLWFTEPASSQLGRMSPSGRLWEYNLADSSNLVGAEEIAAAPNGDMWVSAPEFDRIVRVRPGRCHR